MGLKQIDHGTLDYLQMVDLRYQTLRKPLGLSFSEEELELEKDEWLIAAFDEEDMIGCCVLTPIDQFTLRLRQMAVHPELQGTGIGESIIHFSENLAKDKGYERIIMHARDTAIGFYEKFGYRVVGQEFTEVSIPHHLMEKELRD
jgi:N-acetylglutamate synthase-like GNAT family acetyltransferase